MIVVLTNAERAALIEAARAQTDDLAVVDHEGDPALDALSSALAKLEGGSL